MDVFNSQTIDERKYGFLDVRSSLDAVLTDPQCPPFLQTALLGKLTWQKRCEFNIAKTLKSPSLAPHWIGALLAWGAEAKLEDGSVQSLSHIVGVPNRANPITSICMPLDVPGRVWSEARTSSTPQDYPSVWVMAVVDILDGFVQNARIALCGVWRQSVALSQAASLLVNSPLGAESIERVSGAVLEEVDPKGDYRGSAEYRRAMSGLLTYRALADCMEGAKV